MILMVVTVTTVGGVWRHVCDAARALEDRGRSVRLMIPDGAAALREDAAAQGLLLHDARRPPRGALCHFHAADTYDRALLKAMLRARARRCAVVVTEHLPRTDASDTTLTADRRRRLAWWAKTLQKTLQFAVSDATIAVSESSAHFLALRYGRGRGEFTVVRNGVALSAEAARGFHTSVLSTPATVTAAGAMLRQKGFDVLLRALASSTGDWRLVLAGTGPHLEGHRALAAELGVSDRVDFVGWQPSGRRVFRSGRVVVVPSRWEAAPYVVLEAMSEGRPVVATRFSGVDEVVVDGKTGVLVGVDDHVALAAELDRLVADPERCTAMGDLARRRLEEMPGLTVEEMIDGLLAVYAGVEAQ